MAKDKREEKIVKAENRQTEAIEKVADKIGGQEEGASAGGGKTVSQTQPSSQSSPAVRKISGGWWVFIFALVVWILDYSSGFNGIRADIFIGRVTLGALNLRTPGIPLFARETLWRLFINPIFWIPIISYVVIKGEWRNVRGRIGDLASFMAMIYVPAAIFLLGGFSGVGLAHLGLAVVFYIVILTKYYENNIPRARWVFVACLLIDFFGYGIAREVSLNLGYLTNRVIVPFWVYISLRYIHKSNPSKLTSALWVILISANVFILVTATPIAAIDLSQTLGPEQAQEAIEAAGTGIDNFKKWVGQLFSDIRKSADQQLEYATGGYYRGRVEENEEEQIGVYIENVEVADKQFYENEQVVIWGDLEAKTLDDPIYIYMSCESGDEKGTIIPGALAKKEYFTDYKEGYMIEKLEQIGFECRFEPGQLKTGTNSIKIKAEFNFETLAFLKTYFMDIERVRALRRDNVDPLTEYGIKDKNPVAVFTNGPVKLGMGTVDPPVGVNAEDEAYSYIGVTIERQWLGRIKNITELTIQVPDMLQLEPSSGELFCRNDFKKIGESEDGYIVYTMTEDAIKLIKMPITQFRSWRCSITVPKASEVLGKTPVTTYFYRANTKYVYEVEEPISIFVKSVPKEKTKLTGCDVNCTDNDGCICETGDKCNMPDKTEISKGYTCNNYPGAESKLRNFGESLDFIENAENYITTAIRINELCLRGETWGLNDTIDSLDASKEEREELKSLTEGCEKRSYRFFQLSEKSIVDKVKETLNIFKHIKNDLQLDEDDKEKINDEKDSFIGKLYTVIENFNRIDEDGIEFEKKAQYKKAVEDAENELEGMAFG